MQPVSVPLEVFRGDDVVLRFRLRSMQDGARVPLDPVGSIFELQVDRAFFYSPRVIDGETVVGDLELLDADDATDVLWRAGPTQTDKIQSGRISTFSFRRITPGVRGKRTLVTGSIRGNDANDPSAGDVTLDMVVTEGDVTVDVVVGDVTPETAAYRDQAQAARNAAEGFKNAAEGFKNTASGAAGAAAGSAGTATTKANEAAASATFADGRAGVASSQAGLATAKAVEAAAAAAAALAEDNVEAAVAANGPIFTSWADLQANTVALRGELVTDVVDPTRIGTYGRVTPNNPATIWVKRSSATTTGNDARITAEEAARKALVKKSDRSQFRRISRDSGRFVGGFVTTDGRRLGVFAGARKTSRGAFSYVIRDSGRFVGGAVVKAGPTLGVLSKPFRVAPKTGFNRMSRDAGRFVGGAITAEGARLGIFGGSAASAGGAIAVPPYVEGPSVRDSWDEGVDDCNIFWGQSNNYVNFDSDPLLASAALNPAHALMPPGGPRYSGGAFEALVPLVESVGAGSQQETPASGYANHLIARVLANVGVKPRQFCAVCALTAQPQQNLGRGSPQYQSALAFVANCWKVTRDAGRRMRVRVFSTHSEASKYDQPALYARFLDQLQRNFEDDCRRIVPGLDHVMLFVAPVSSSSKEDLTAANYIEFGPTLGMLEIRNPYIRIANPLYNKPIGADKLHLSNAGKNYVGQDYADAVYQEEAGTGYVTFRPRRDNAFRWVSNRILDMECEVPAARNIVIRSKTDSSAEDVAEPVNTIKGFQIAERGVLRTDYALTVPASPDALNVNKRRVRFTFAADVTGLIDISYADRNDDVVVNNGPIVGARGCVATDRQEANLYDGHLARDYLCRFVVRGIPPFA